MKRRKVALGFLLGISVYCLSGLLLPSSNIQYNSMNSNTVIVAEATDGNLEDDVGGSDVNSSDNGLGSFIKGFRPMTEEHLQTANAKISPLSNMLGYIIGGIVAFISIAIFVMTALDLLYISFPPIRNLLFVDGQQSNMPQQQSTHERRQWISDEAAQCAALMGNNQNSNAITNNGGYGGYGGYGQQQQQPQNVNTQMVLGIYFKKRVFFMVLLAICLVVLLSSIFLGTGVNLAQWLMTIIEQVNGYIPS